MDQFASLKASIAAVRTTEENKKLFDTLDKEFIKLDKASDDTFTYKATDVLVQQTWELPIVVQYPGSTVTFDFTTTMGDIQFGIMFVAALDEGQDESEMYAEVIDEMGRVLSHENAYKGSFEPRCEGVVFFVWDNTHDWYSNKKVTYCIELQQPTFTCIDGDRVALARSLLPTAVATLDACSIAKADNESRAEAVEGRIGALERKIRSLQLQLEEQRREKRRLDRCVEEEAEAEAVLNMTVKSVCMRTLDKQLLMHVLGYVYPMGGRRGADSGGSDGRGILVVCKYWTLLFDEIRLRRVEIFGTRRKALGDSASLVAEEAAVGGASSSASSGTSNGGDTAEGGWADVSALAAGVTPAKAGVHDLSAFATVGSEVTNSPADAESAADADPDGAGGSVNGVAARIVGISNGAAQLRTGGGSSSNSAAALSPSNHNGNSASFSRPRNSKHAPALPMTEEAFLAKRPSERPHTAEERGRTQGAAKKDEKAGVGLLKSKSRSPGRVQAGAADAAAAADDNGEEDAMRLTDRLVRQAAAATAGVEVRTRPAAAADIAVPSSIPSKDAPSGAQRSPSKSPKVSFRRQAEAAGGGGGSSSAAASGNLLKNHRSAKELNAWIDLIQGEINTLETKESERRAVMRALKKWIVEFEAAHDGQAPTKAQVKAESGAIYRAIGNLTADIRDTEEYLVSALANAGVSRAEFDQLAAKRSAEKKRIRAKRRLVRDEPVGGDEAVEEGEGEADEDAAEDEEQEENKS